LLTTAVIRTTRTAVENSGKAEKAAILTRQGWRVFGISWKRILYSQAGSHHICSFIANTSSLKVRFRYSVVVGRKISRLNRKDVFEASSCPVLKMAILNLTFFDPLLLYF